MKQLRPVALLITALTIAGCAIHHVTPYVPDASNAPQTAGAAEASASCGEATTPAEIAICAKPALIDENTIVIETLQARIREASIFERDALLASQRGWLLALSMRCKLPDAPTPAPSSASACLQDALSERAKQLAGWQAARSGPYTAVAQYVTIRSASGAAGQPDRAFCASFAAQANGALRRSGTLNPSQMGYQEVAGSYGAPAAQSITVDLYDANVFALFQRRARSVSIGDGAPLITPISLTQLVDALSTANQGGRFSAFASQTGDYGSIDVFRADTQLLALAAAPWGSTTPAAPGEAAHAGLWNLTSGKPEAVCLFDTYIRPAEPGPLQDFPDLVSWRETLIQIAGQTDLPLGNATRRDQGQLAADTDFTILHMPLVAVQQANLGGWTPWLRHRHDEVLDALFAWSTKNPANKPLFNRAFALLRPAATELVRAYQTTQGLSAVEATQAGSIAIMELLYQATQTIAPDLGADPDMQPGYKARYPILASPQ